MKAGNQNVGSAQRWTFRLPRERNVSTRVPVVSHDTVYVTFDYDRKGFFESTLLALDIATGAQRWSYTIAHIGNEPLVVDDVVYWSSFEGSVHALARDGSLLWKAPASGSNLGVPVAADGNRLFVSEIAGGARHTWCLDRTTGATLWRFAHGGHAYRLWYADERVYHTSISPTAPDDSIRGTLYCLAARDGRVIWSVEGSEYLFNPIAIDERLHVCSHRKLHVYAADDGRRIGAVAVNSDQATMTLAPCSGRDRLVLWRNNTGQGLDSLAAWSVAPVKRWFGGERLEATRLWTVDEPRFLCDAPIALSGDRLAYLTHDGTVQLLSAATGERAWEGVLKTGPSTTGGLVQVGDGLIATHGRDVVRMTPGA